MKNTQNNEDRPTVWHLKQSLAIHQNQPLRCLLDDDYRWLRVNGIKDGHLDVTVENIHGSWRNQDISGFDDSMPVIITYECSPMRFLNLRDGFVRLKWLED